MLGILLYDFVELQEAAAELGISVHIDYEGCRLFLTDNLSCVDIAKVDSIIEAKAFIAGYRKAQEVKK